MQANRRALVFCGLLSSSAFCANQALAQAQTSAPPSAAQGAGGPRSGLEDIVVTARRVSESLQKVPVSVGTLNAQALTSRQILNVNDLKGAVVGLTTSRTSTAANAYITIRGVTGQALPTPAADSGIGLYLDGVYIARGPGAGVDIPDLARVEVLRGPQGTLFGRNSDLGAINFITEVPKTDKAELKFDALYGNYNHFRGSVIANEPITSTLAVRFSYQHNQEDGDVKNPNTGTGYIIDGKRIKPTSTYDSTNSNSYMAKVRWTGIDGLTVDYKYDREDFIESPGPNQILGFLPSAFASTLAFLYPYQAPGAVVQSFKRLSSVNSDWQTKSPVHNDGHLITLEYVVNDNFSLKNISAWRKTHSSSNVDLDGADWTIPAFISGAPQQFCVSCSTNDLRQHQFSQEDQIIGRFQRFNFIAGGYYFEEHASFLEQYYIGQVFPAAPATYTAPTDPSGPYLLGELGSYKNKAYAGYFHGEFSLTDQLKLSGGVRYTNDQRHTIDERAFSPGTYTANYKKVTWDAAINYQLSSDKLLYGRYSTGYTSGGILGNIAFKPETAKQAEVGFKGEFWDRRIRANVAGYYTWIKDRQVAIPSVDPNNNAVLAAAGYTPPYPLGIFIYNQPGTSTVWGFEIETVFAPTRGVSLSANYSYNKPHNSDGSFYRAPKQNFSFSGEYDFSKSDDGSYLLVRMDGDYRSKYFGTGATSQAVFEGDVPAALRPGYATSADYLAALEKASEAGDYWLINARVSLADIPLGGAKARISGFVQNLNNSKGLLYTVNYGFSMHGIFERPRTYGLEVNLQF